MGGIRCSWSFIAAGYFETRKTGVCVCLWAAFDSDSGRIEGVLDTGIRVFVIDIMRQRGSIIDKALWCAFRDLRSDSRWHEPKTSYAMHRAYLTCNERACGR